MRNLSWSQFGPYSNREGLARALSLGGYTGGYNKTQMFHTNQYQSDRTKGMCPDQVAMLKDAFGVGSLN